jgi:hypothetical protein
MSNEIVINGVVYELLSFKDNTPKPQSNLDFVTHIPNEYQLSTNMYNAINLARNLTRSTAIMEAYLDSLYDALSKLPNVNRHMSISDESSSSDYKESTSGGSSSNESESEMITTHTHSDRQLNTFITESSRPIRTIKPPVRKTTESRLRITVQTPLRKTIKLPVRREMKDPIDKKYYKIGCPTDVEELSKMLYFRHKHHSILDQEKFVLYTNYAKFLLDNHIVNHTVMVNKVPTLESINGIMLTRIKIYLALINEKLIEINQYCCSFYYCYRGSDNVEIAMYTYEKYYLKHYYISNRLPELMKETDYTVSFMKLKCIKCIISNMNYDIARGIFNIQSKTIQQIKV